MTVLDTIRAYLPASRERWCCIGSRGAEARPACHNERQHSDQVAHQLVKIIDTHEAALDPGGAGAFEQSGRAIQRRPLAAVKPNQAA